MDSLINKQRLEYALLMSEFVYNQITHATVRLAEHGYTNVLPLSKKWSDTEAFCAIEGQSAKIVFRGSASFVDWVVDLALLPAYRPRVHMGFGLAWRSVRNDIVGWLESHKSNYKNVCLYGHSLGVALLR